MKTAVFLISYFCNAAFVHGQSESRLNCIIFLDGKLVKVEGHFEYLQDNEIIEIPFTYVIGDMALSTEDFKTLQNIQGSDSLFIVLNYRPYRGESRRLRGGIHYPQQLFESSCIIRFTTLNRKKQTYYFGVSSPTRSKAFLKRKEYIMVEQY